MEFMILDSAGNAVASYEDDLTARAVLHATVAVEPEAADHLVLLAYDDDGMPVGDALTVFDVQPGFVVEPSPFEQVRETQALIRERLLARTLYFENRLPAWQPGVQGAEVPA